MNKELKILRLRHDFTQEKLANCLGITKQAYSLKELGKRPFTLKDVKKMKKIFKLTTEEIEQIFLN